MATYGVTGGSGFIGGYVLQELARRGHRVISFDPHSRISREVFDGLNTYDNEAISQRLGDVRDETAVFELAAHVDGIIHLAAVLGTQETIQCPRPSAETNILGSLNVFEAASRYKLPVAYAGVGNHFMRLDGTGAYTISKSAAEDFARMFNAYRDGRIAIVRPVNAYGPRQSIAEPFGSSKVRKILPSFSCRALIGQPIEVYGDGNQISDCVYVADVARVFVAALEAAAAGDLPAKPVEVGPAESCTVNDIADQVRIFAAELTGRPMVELKHLPMRPGEVPNAVVKADVSTLSQLGLDVADFVPLGEGIRRTVEYYAEQWLPGYLEGAA